jgi:PRTRC genetic system protein C
MQIQQTERVFRYSGGLVLPDPDPSLEIEAVRQVYASSYPEIIRAAVSVRNWWRENRSSRSRRQWPQKADLH